MGSGLPHFAPDGARAASGRAGTRLADGLARRGLMTLLSLLVTLVLGALPQSGRPPDPAQSASTKPAAAQPGQVNPTGAAMLEFKERVDAYVKVHNEAESKVPKLTETNDPQKVVGREKALGEMIRSLRSTAKEGDVFTANARKVFAREIRKDFRERSAADRKALIHELPAGLKLSVNMIYPAELPLATFPARLLSKLPDLPPELEYRIVGHHLLLRDVTANVVVDIARNIVPTITS
jgi:hypothetical protein